MEGTPPEGPWGICHLPSLPRSKGAPWNHNWGWTQLLSTSGSPSSRKTAANSWIRIKMPPWSTPQGWMCRMQIKPQTILFAAIPRQNTADPGKPKAGAAPSQANTTRDTSAPCWLFPIKSGWFCPEELTEIPANLKEQEKSPASPNMQQWRGCRDANWQQAGREQNIPKKPPHFPHLKEPGGGGSSNPCPKSG